MSRTTLYFLVTNSLHQDQRLQRICSTLAEHNYEVHCVGAKKRNPVYNSSKFKCHSLSLFFKKGPLFYLEINLRFFFFLLFKKMDAVVANDLDTLLAAKFIILLRSKKLFIDLHEYFTEVPELENKGSKKRIWNFIASIGIGGDSTHYTVNESLAKVFEEKHGATFTSIYNYPYHVPNNINKPENNTLRLVYVGMVNRGRGIKEIIQSLNDLEGVDLTIFGDGDEYEACQSLIEDLNLTNRVDLHGFTNYNEIIEELPTFDLGLNLLNESSLNYYYSSANKFFDYTMAGIPSLNMDFPEYQRLNQQHEVAILLTACNVDLIKQTLRSLKSNPNRLVSLRRNCINAREEWCWQNEAPKLLELYNAQFY